MDNGVVNVINIIFKKVISIFYSIFKYIKYLTRIERKKTR